MSNPNAKAQAKKGKLCPRGLDCKAVKELKSGPVPQRMGVNNTHSMCPHCTIFQADGQHFGGNHSSPWPDCKDCLNFTGPTFRGLREQGAWFRYTLQTYGKGQWLASKPAVLALSTESALVKYDVSLEFNSGFYTPGNLIDQDDSPSEDDSSQEDDGSHHEGDDPQEESGSPSKADLQEEYIYVQEENGDESLSDSGSGSVHTEATIEEIDLLTPGQRSPQSSSGGSEAAVSDSKGAFPIAETQQFARVSPSYTPPSELRRMGEHKALSSGVSTSEVALVSSTGPPLNGKPLSGSPTPPHGGVPPLSGNTLPLKTPSGNTLPLVSSGGITMPLEVPSGNTLPLEGGKDLSGNALLLQGSLKSRAAATLPLNTLAASLMPLKSSRRLPGASQGSETSSPRHQGLVAQKSGFTPPQVSLDRQVALRTRSPMLHDSQDMAMGGTLLSTFGGGGLPSGPPPGYPVQPSGQNPLLRAAGVFLEQMPGIGGLIQGSELQRRALEAIVAAASLGVPRPQAARSTIPDLRPPPKPRRITSLPAAAGAPPGGFHAVSPLALRERQDDRVPSQGVERPSPSKKEPAHASPDHPSIKVEQATPIQKGRSHHGTGAPEAPPLAGTGTIEDVDASGRSRQRSRGSKRGRVSPSPRPRRRYRSRSPTRSAPQPGQGDQSVILPSTAGVIPSPNEVLVLPFDKGQMGPAWQSDEALIQVVPRLLVARQPGFPAHRMPCWENRPEPYNFRHVSLSFSEDQQGIYKAHSLTESGRVEEEIFCAVEVRGFRDSPQVTFVVRHPIKGDKDMEVVPLIHPVWVYGLPLGQPPSRPARSASPLAAVPQPAHEVVLISDGEDQSPVKIEAVSPLAQVTTRQVRQQSLSKVRSPHRGSARTRRPQLDTGPVGMSVPPRGRDNTRPLENIRGRRRPASPTFNRRSGSSPGAASFDTPVPLGYGEHSGTFRLPVLGDPDSSPSTLPSGVVGLPGAEGPEAAQDATDVMANILTTMLKALQAVPKRGPPAPVKPPPKYHVAQGETLDKVRLDHEIQARRVNAYMRQHHGTGPDAWPEMDPSQCGQLAGHPALPRSTTDPVGGDIAVDVSVPLVGLPVLPQASGLVRGVLHAPHEREDAHPTGTFHRGVVAYEPHYIAEVAFQRGPTSKEMWDILGVSQTRNPEKVIEGMRSKLKGKTPSYVRPATLVQQRVAQGTLKCGFLSHAAASAAFHCSRDIEGSVSALEASMKGLGKSLSALDSPSREYLTQRGISAVEINNNLRRLTSVAEASQACRAAANVACNVALATCDLAAHRIAQTQCTLRGETLAAMGATADPDSGPIQVIREDPAYAPNLFGRVGLTGKLEEVRLKQKSWGNFNELTDPGGALLKTVATTSSKSGRKWSSAQQSRHDKATAASKKAAGVDSSTRRSSPTKRSHSSKTKKQHTAKRQKSTGSTEASAASAPAKSKSSTSKASKKPKKKKGKDKDGKTKK